MQGVTSNAPQQPPPGWYDDPSGTDRQRWWNGSAWGDQYQARPSGPTWMPTDRTGGLDTRTWVILTHASALLAAWVGVAFLGPLVVYLLRKDDAPEIRAHAAAALNFQLSWLIWGIVLGIATVLLSLIVIGLALIPVIIIGAIAWFVITIMASAKASNGGPPMRYPLTIAFVR